MAPPKGNVPWNKGKKLHYEVWNKGKKTGVMPSTVFKKGEPGYWLNKERPDMRGANHPNWKGGKCADKRHSCLPGYQKWRRQVFQRDDYTCQECGIRGNETGGYLEAHHIKAWSRFPDNRFDIDNGQTLCKECHMKTDNYKGRLNREGL